MHQFRLYLSEINETSNAIAAEVKSSLTAALQGRFSLQIIEVLDNPELALEDLVLVTPTLLRKSPPPPRKIFGNLRDRARVLRGLGLS